MALDAPLSYLLLPGAYALTAAVTLGLTWYLRARHGEKPTATALAVVGGFLAIWAVGMGGRVASRTLAGTLAWNTLAYVGIVGTAVAWLAFALHYTGRGRYLTRPVLGLLSLPGLVLVGLVATSGSHRLYYADMRLVEGVGGHLVFLTDETLLFYAFAGWHYALFLVGTGLILGFVLTAHRTHRLHAAVLAVGAIGPLAVNALYVTDVLGTGFDPTPFAFGVSVLLVAAAVLDAAFLDILPVARDHIVEGLAEGIVVLDSSDRIIDFNRHAATLLVSPETAVGKPVGAHLPQALAESTVVQGTAPPGERVEVAMGEGRWSRLSRQALDTGGVAGSLLVIADATDTKRREQQLEAHNRRLEEFASVVAHDLRNPLAVAVGRLEMARGDRDSDDLAAVTEALDRIDDILSTMLTLAREGLTIRDPTPVDLPGLVESAWANVDTDAVALEVDLLDLPPVLADGDRLLQVFENLFRNAVEQAVSRVAVGPLVGGFYVEDDGPGFPPGSLDRVFDDGFSTTEGTGLGLRIVAEIAAAHGWAVAARAGSEGGARVEFTGLAFATATPESDRRAEPWPEPADG